MVAIPAHQLADRFDGEGHMIQLIQAVKDPEHIHPVFRRQSQEFPDHFRGIIGITHRIGPPGQHLEQDVGGCLAHEPEPLPRIFIQETVGHIESGTAPVFKSIQLGYLLSRIMDGPQDIPGPDPSGQERLVGIPVGGIHQQYLFLV